MIDDDVFIPVICAECGAEIDAGDARSHNDNLSDHTITCFDCHMDMLDNGKITQCEECGNTFHSKHLKPGRPNEINEICPYCGKIWCE